MTQQTLTLGSRGSQLALWQARYIQARLKELGVETRIEIIKTTGDKITDVPLAKVGGKGLFTKEIEEALLDRRIDLAVHSLKDLPTVLPPGLAVAAIPERELCYDALVGAKLSELKQGARVGTSSLRRAAQLKRLRPDLDIRDLRGNLDTRLRKLDEGQYDAIVLAAAGLRRLGWGERIAELLPADVVCPAVGQGALAIETRANDEAFAICAQLDHRATRVAVEAERAVLEALGGGCQVPIGAHAVLEGDALKLSAVVVHPDGSTLVSEERTGDAATATELGKGVAHTLLERGAREILRAVYGTALPLAGRRVVVTRAAEQACELVDTLRRLGAEVVELPVIEFAAPASWVAFDTAIKQSYDWVVFTSSNGVRFAARRAKETNTSLAQLRAKVCVVGPATAAAAENHGLSVTLTPTEFTGAALGAALAAQQGSMNGQRVLLLQAEVTSGAAASALRAAGAQVDEVTVYRTVAPADLNERARAVFATGEPDWITFTSGSTVNNLTAAVDLKRCAKTRLASIGPATSETMRQLGLTVSVEAEPSTAEGLAEAIARVELR